MSNTTSTKMTYGKALDFVLNTCDLPTDVAERLTALQASIAKKNSAVRKPTAKQVANGEFKQDILDFMVEGRIYSCAEIAKECPALVENGISSARTSALLTQLADAGLLTKTVEKRKNYYSLA